MPGDWGGLGPLVYASGPLRGVVAGRRTPRRPGTGRHPTAPLVYDICSPDVSVSSWRAYLKRSRVHNSTPVLSGSCRLPPVGYLTPENYRRQRLRSCTVFVFELFVESRRVFPIAVVFVASVDVTPLEFH